VPTRPFPTPTEPRRCSPPPVPDHHIGRIFEQLKTSGQWSNTIIIFSADNGLSMGEHGLFGKQNLYEFGGMHVPCVIAGPGIARGRSDALVYLMDLFPTFAEFAGAKNPDGVEGKSLVPLLVGREAKVRDVLYTGYRHCMRAIRDDRWKLIRYPLVDRTQLFDLSSDPRELSNLADKPAHAAKVAELMALLQKEMTAYSDTSPLKVSNPTPAEWTPPARGDKPATKEEKQAATATAAQPTGRIRKDSKLHFMNWDGDKDGFLTLEEFQRGQKNRKGLEATFKSYDTNADGKLSREEYVDPRAR
jgi:hypothetical protein